MLRSKWLWLFVLLALGAILIGCRAPDAALAPVDLATLPVDIDVKTAASLRDRSDVVFLDVREQWEYDEGHIPGITLIPMNDIPARLNQIPTDKTVIITCRSGNRSNTITEYLRDNGFDNVHNMLGGILAWEAAQQPVER